MDSFRVLVFLVLGLSSLHLPSGPGLSGVAAEYTWNGKDWVWNEEGDSGSNDGSGDGGNNRGGGGGGRRNNQDVGVSDNRDNYNQNSNNDRNPSFDEGSGAGGVVRYDDDSDNNRDYEDPRDNNYRDYPDNSRNDDDDYDDEDIYVESDVPRNNAPPPQQQYPPPSNEGPIEGVYNNGGYDGGVVNNNNDNGGDYGSRNGGFDSHDRSGGHPSQTPSFFAQPGTLAAIVGGAVVGLLCAILCVMFVVYRMRKKDEGSYALDEPKRSPTVNSYSKPPSREFYA